MALPRRRAIHGPASVTLRRYLPLFFNFLFHGYVNSLLSLFCAHDFFTTIFTTPRTGVVKVVQKLQERIKIETGMGMVDLSVSGSTEILGAKLLREPLLARGSIRFSGSQKWNCSGAFICKTKHRFLPYQKVRLSTQKYFILIIQRKVEPRKTASLGSRDFPIPECHFDSEIAAIAR